MNDSNHSNDSFLNKNISRRDILRLAGVGSAGLMLGVGAAFGLLAAQETARTSQDDGSSKQQIPFYDQKHQSGIVTPAQDFVCFATFDLTTTSAMDLKKLFQSWTEVAASLTSGQLIGENNDNPNLPPTDTGEAAELDPSRLTITFGAGPSLFDARFGLASKRPAELVDLPSFLGDDLQEQWCGGDLCVQVCANDPQVAFHAVRNLARIARGTAVLRWIQEGFQRTAHSDPANGTPRNLMGFKDGTVNPNIHDEQDMNEVVWAESSGNASWMKGGSYMVVRRIRMRIEVWDRSTLSDQETTFGRYRHNGAPLGGKDEFDKADFDAKDSTGNPVILDHSHMKLAHGDGSQRILRRGYSYSSGIDMGTGQLDAGLLFISYQKDPRKQFIPIQQRLSKSDKLNEYILTVGSAIFACFPGVKEGGYIGDSLL